MLHTNLSTRPFYNERAAQLALGAAALLVVAFTVFNVVEYRSLSARHAGLLARVDGDESAAATMRATADRERRSLNRAELDRVAAEAREANDLIDRRVFSWTGLLDTIEATIPANVRVISLKPFVDRDGHLSVAIVAVGHQAEDIQEFVDRLEAAGSFSQIVSRNEATSPQGLLEVALEGRYTPGEARKPAEAAGKAAAPKPADAVKKSAAAAPATAVKPAGASRPPATPAGRGRKD